MSIKSIKVLDHGLNICWSNNSSSCYPWFWLKDHSESANDLHPDTKQRQIDSFSNPLECDAHRAWFDKETKNVFIEWTDKTQSCLSISLLKLMAKPRPQPS